MIPDNVTLIVKAPNQQVEDQNVECLSSWTVRQLKGHLSDVYPNKPRTDEQKIIYSGQLLDDNTILKDVLRTYESQLTHTMHLVCTPKRIPPEPTPPEPNTDGLRHRSVAETERERPVEVTRPETRQNDQNHTVEMQNYLNSFANNYGRVPPYPNYNMGEGFPLIPNDPAALANQMMMMQQAYFQYMQQYANMWQAGAPAPPPAAAEPPPAPEADAAAPEDDDFRLHDWLDHLYAASRLAILFSLVYLYGSPARLLLVVLLAAAGYLHQIGFFRDLQLNPAPQNPRRVRAAGLRNRLRGNVNPERQNANPDRDNANPIRGNANPNHENANPIRENANPIRENANQNNDNVIPNRNANDVTVVDNEDETPQTLLAVTWMVFSSFFASLIPDTN